MFASIIPDAAGIRLARPAGPAGPGVPLPVPIGRLPGLRAEQLRFAPGVGTAVRRFLAFAGDAPLVAHNARFDLAFLNRQLERSTGRRVAATVLDTVPLARNLLA